MAAATGSSISSRRTVLLQALPRRWAHLAQARETVSAQGVTGVREGMAGKRRCLAFRRHPWGCMVALALALAVEEWPLP